jgi:hypothetical protein
MRKNKINRADVIGLSDYRLSILRLLDPASRDPAGQNRGDEVPELWDGV